MPERKGWPGGRQEPSRGRRINSLVDSFRKGILRVNPLGGGSRGPELEYEEKEELSLRKVPGTAAHLRAIPGQEVPLKEAVEIRKRRKNMRGGDI